MNLSDITYPVYKLKDSPPLKEDGVVYYVLTDYTTDKMEIRVVDDTTIPGTTLALRRLKLKDKEVPLLKINRGIFFLGDLIKIAKKGSWFIDSLGNTFEYKKQTRANLSFHKVLKLFPIDTGGVIIEVEGISSRFKALFAPNIDRNSLYAGILHNGMSKILYGFTDTKHEDTWRLI